MSGVYPSFPILQGSHAPERQIYMSAAVHLLGAEARSISVLEVGTYMGSSMFTWAKSMERFSRGGEIYCVDAWDEVDLDQYKNTPVIADSFTSGSVHRVFREALKFVPDNVKVTELKGQSADILPSLAGKKFDIIYIDGCHLHPEMLADIKACDGLLAEGGFMCGDDLEVQLNKTDPFFVAGLGRVDYTRDPKSGVGFHPGVTLGVGTFFGEVSVYGGFWIMQKSNGTYKKVWMRGKGILPYHWPKESQMDAMTRVLGAGFITEIV